MEEAAMSAFPDLRRAGVVVAVVVAAVPSVASARVHGPLPHTGSAAAGGSVFGGVTAQGWPISLTLSRSRRQVTRAVVGIRMDCTSQSVVNIPDTYVRMRISKRRFGASFGPTTTRNDDGTTTDFEGSMSGRLNAARTKMSGSWRLKLTDHDVAGAVTDTCDSERVSWTAKD
jgi:hypothetical protein